MRYLQQHLPDYDGRFRSVSEAQGILGFRIAHGLREQDMTFYERALAAAWLDPEINYIAEGLRALIFYRDVRLANRQVQA